MDIMIIIDIVIAVFGIYMIGASLKMKKTGNISSVIITEEEIAKCKDKQGFIAFMYWKETAFGGVLVLVGALGLIDSLVASLGKWNIVELIVFLAAFVWFQTELRKARVKYI